MVVTTFWYTASFIHNTRRLTTHTHTYTRTHARTHARTHTHTITEVYTYVGPMISQYYNYDHLLLHQCMLTTTFRIILNIGTIPISAPFEKS